MSLFQIQLDRKLIDRIPIDVRGGGRRAWQETDTAEDCWVEKYLRLVLSTAVGYEAATGIVDEVMVAIRSK